MPAKATPHTPPSSLPSSPPSSPRSIQERSRSCRGCDDMRANINRGLSYRHVHLKGGRVFAWNSRGDLRLTTSCDKPWGRAFAIVEVPKEKVALYFSSMKPKKAAGAASMEHDPAV